LKCPPYEIDHDLIPEFEFGNDNQMPLTQREIWDEAAVAVFSVR
jgi:hypothetical protein